ncbi:hypothetical protein BD770DRAFT_403531 [Pilaira anomala]|nr:hypothetical protein BD770DRAFT_403531 [Pilaira anomala]
MSKMFSFGNNKNSGDCDGWRDKLFGKVILNDDEQTGLAADEYIRKKDLPQPNRILPPNSIMTMDYRPDRLNIHVDHTMRVTSVNQG